MCTRKKKKLFLVNWNSSLLDDIHENSLGTGRFANLGGLNLPNIWKIRKLDEGCAFEKAAKKGKVVDGRFALDKDGA